MVCLMLCVKLPGDTWLFVLAIFHDCSLKKTVLLHLFGASPTRFYTPCFYLMFNRCLSVCTIRSYVCTYVWHYCNNLSCMLQPQRHCTVQDICILCTCQCFYTLGRCSTLRLCHCCNSGFIWWFVLCVCLKHTLVFHYFCSLIIHLNMWAYNHGIPGHRKMTCALPSR